MSEDRESTHPPGGQTRGPRDLARLAAGQQGVVSRGQLLDARMTERMIETRLATGQLVRLHRGVYAVGHAHLRPNGYRLAGVLAVGPGAVLSHRDAAALHGLRDGGGVRIDVSTPAERRSTRRIRVHGRRRLDAADVTSVEGIPVTTVSRTLVDLGEVLAHQQLTKVCSEAERRRVLDLKGIEEALGRLRGRRGQSAARLRAALSELERHGATLTRSPLEDRLIPLLDANDLPRPATNSYVEGYECDAVWRAQRLAIELDGWDAHKTRRAFQHDRTKANALTNAGWTVLRFTHDDLVRRPEVVAAGVRAQLTRAAGSARPPRADDRPA
jgi:predicted transcriptional regulator of viral defense system